MTEFDDKTTELISLIVPDDCFAERLDLVVARLCPQYSRSQLQKWIKAGAVTVNGETAGVRDKLYGGESISIKPRLQQQTTDQAEPIALDIIFEDDQLLVINKPAGLVVHPGAGNPDGTLVNGLLAYRDLQKTLPRAGIVHRLDKDTSGLMMVAKTLEAHAALVNQLQAREVKREYLALVASEVIAGDTIVGNIGRHPRDRKRMAVLERRGKEAVTHYRVEQRLFGHTLLRVSLETGRTHQIRVHLAWKHMPIVGDSVYGGRPRIPAGLDDSAREFLQQFGRQALHATRLTVAHPVTGEMMSWEAGMPTDMRQLVDLVGFSTE